MTDTTGRRPDSCRGGSRVAERLRPSDLKTAQGRQGAYKGRVDDGLAYHTAINLFQRGEGWHAVRAKDQNAARGAELSLTATHAPGGD